MKTAFFDVDYTLYDGYLGTNFNLFMVKRGYAGDKVAKAEAELIRDYSAGVIDYREAASRALQLHADCLKGRTLEEVGEIQLEFAKDNLKLFPWARSVIKELRSKIFEVYLISAAPVTAIKSIADALEIEYYYGTELVVRDGRYTGELETVLNYEAKHQQIQALISKTPGDLHIGFGDSPGDVDMLSAMDHAFLYEPKPGELIAIAKEKGWTIASKDTIESLIKAL